MISFLKTKLILGWSMLSLIAFFLQEDALAKEEITSSEIKEVLIRLEEGQKRLNEELLLRTETITKRIDNLHDSLGKKIDDLRATFVTLSAGFFVLIGVLLGFTINLHSRVGRIEGRIQGMLAKKQLRE